MAQGQQNKSAKGSAKITKADTKKGGAGKNPPPKTKGVGSVGRNPKPK